MQRDLSNHDGRTLAIAVSTDPVFGPVIAFGASARSSTRIVCPRGHAASPQSPPGTRFRPGGVERAVPPPESLIDLLLRVSALVCELPWVCALALDPVLVTADGAAVVGARVDVDPRRRAGPGYRHMAIHPYPTGLEAEVVLADGARLKVRPVRPEDAELERRFVASLSDQTRYFRFFYRLHELTPAMIARFTQVDYDREVALLALEADPAAPTGETIVGISRYITNHDGESAEFAVVVTDTWHGRGVGRMLMERIIACAKKKGLKRLEGIVLRANQSMLQFSAELGFQLKDDANEPEQVTVVLPLS